MNLIRRVCSFQTPSGPENPGENIGRSTPLKQWPPQIVRSGSADNLQLVHFPLCSQKKGTNRRTSRPKILTCQRVKPQLSRVNLSTPRSDGNLTEEVMLRIILKQGHIFSFWFKTFRCIAATNAFTEPLAVTAQQKSHPCPIENLARNCRLE